MADLIIYSSAAGATAPQILAANILRYKNPTATLKDVSGITTGNIDTYIGTLVDGTYTNIWIVCTTQAGGATSLLTYDQVAALAPKLITANQGVVRTGTCQANSTATNIIFDSSASSVNDAYNNMFVVTSGTTAKARMITDYVGSTVTATVVTTTTAITTTETFTIYNPTTLYQLGNVSSTTGKTAAAQAWENAYPGTSYPAIVKYLSGYLVNLASGTAASVSAGGLTMAGSLTTGDRASVAEYSTVDFFKDKWVYIYSSTLGFGQYAQIESNDASQALTLTANWKVTPTGTVIYRVVDSENLCNLDKACEVIVESFMLNPAGTTQYKFNDYLMLSTIELQERLFDAYLELANGYAPATVDTDMDLFNDLTQKSIFAVYCDALGGI